MTFKNKCSICGHKYIDVTLEHDGCCSICWANEARKWKAKCGELMDVIRRAEVLLSELYTRNEMALTQFEEAKKKLNAIDNE